MVTSLVGYTGFVGSNIVGEYNFNNLYNSKNISDSYGTRPDILIYAGVRAEKFIANNEPEQDYKIVEEAFSNIKQINAKKVVLISTIDVYKKPILVNEDTVIDTENLHPYGLNRYYLEQWVSKEFDSTIIRLPGLFGRNIKKNFIFDLIHIIPTMLKKEKFLELSQVNIDLHKYYYLVDNGFYRCKDLNTDERSILKTIFEEICFSAINFTDSRGDFQFYNLAYLWRHIKIALNNNINILNLATEPVNIGEMYNIIYHKEFKNEITNVIPKYNYLTKYDELYEGKDGYIFSKEKVLADILKFVKGYSV